MPEDRLKRLGRWVVSHRLGVILFWCLLLGAGAFFSSKVDGILQGGTSLPGSQTEQVAKILRDKFGNQYANEQVIVFYSKDRPADDLEFQMAVEKVQMGLRESVKVNSINTYYDLLTEDMISPDKHSILAVATLDVKDTFEAQEAIPELRGAVAKAGVPDWLQVYMVGEGAVFYDLIHASAQDAFWAESRSFPLVVLILVFSFGALLAAGIPVILGTVAVVIALGLLYFLGQFTSVFVVAKNAVSMIGLGVGIDYSLFMVSRFREELKLGIDPKDAAASIMTTSGRTVLFSGSTVVVGLASVFLAGMSFLNSMALAAIMVVITSVLAALTLLPAILSYLGKTVNWPYRLSDWIDRSKTGRGWHRLATRVMGHPVVFFLVTMAILLSLAWPLMHIRTYTPTVTSLPRGVESRAGFERLQSDFIAGKMAPINIIIRAPEGQSVWSADAVERLYKFSRLMGQDKRIYKVEGIMDMGPTLTLQDYLSLYSDQGGLSGSANMFAQMARSYTDSDGQGKMTLMRVTTHDEPGSLTSREVVREIRNHWAPEAFGGTGFEILVGGGAAGEVDMDQAVMSRLPWIIGVVCVVTFLILVVLFRSILIPLKSIFMNLLSVLASFGMLVLTFQDGFMTNLLGIKAPGGISSIILTMLFAVLFGLSMDYEIFLTLRMKEEHDHGKTNEESVAWGLEHTGGLVTSAALIMFVVFGAFAFTSMMMTQEFGLGLAAAVLLDATVIRILLMPATMRLLGEYNWWFPKSLEKILPKMDIKG